MPIVHALTDLQTSPTTARFEGQRDADDVDLAFYVTRTSPGEGPALHVHPYAEVFILHEGQARYTIGDEELTVGAGHVIVVPANTPHRFQNIGDSPLLVVSVHERGTMRQTNLDPPPLDATAEQR